MIHRRRRHVRSIEGLRAVAVAAVVAYHAGATWLPGGFLGVDVFFVVSGYLIAGGLLQEWDANGALDVRSFWWRRARRLLPALGFLLAGTSVLALLVAPDAIPRLRGDALAALTYSSNWWQIAAGQSYFEALGRSPLLRHLWSLAVEEQFYLAFPLALGAVLPRVRSQARLVAGVLGLAVASTVWMAVLWSPGDDPSRVYFGSDTRLAGLLVGVAVAAVVGGRSLRTLPGRWAKPATGLGGVGLAVAFLRVGDTSPWLYDGGGFLVVAVAAALLLVGSGHRASITGRILGCRPLRWVGSRSYAIYLWHWPVQELTRPSVDVPWSGPGLVVARLVLVGLLSEMSWRFVEQPVRIGRLRVWWDAREPRRRRCDVALAGAAAALLVLPMVMTTTERQWWETEPAVVSAAGATMQIDPASAPVSDVGTARALSVIGTFFGPLVLVPPSAAPLSPAPSAPPVPAMTAPPPAPRPASGGGPAAPRPRPPASSPPTTTVPPTAAEPAPPPAPSDVAVLAVGDSVMVAARSALLAEGGSGTRVDAVVGRQNDATLTVLERYRDDGTLALTERLIVHIGTNGPLTQTQFDRLVRIAADVPDVVVVNVRVPKSWESQSNRVIADNVPSTGGMRLADWYETSKNPGVLGRDGVHPTPSGARVYARLALTPPPEPEPAPAPEPDPASTDPEATTTTTAPPPEPEPAPPTTDPPAGE